MSVFNSVNPAKMNLALVMPFYGRHELTKIVLESYPAMAKRHNLILIAAGSEGSASRELCEEAGWNYIEVPNQPLSQKINALFLEAQKRGVDGVIIVGSDNLMQEKVLDYYESFFSANTRELIGVDKIYIHSLDENISLKWGGYLGIYREHTIGVGRFFSKWILDRMNWMPMRNEKLNRGMDGAMANHLQHLKIPQRKIAMETLGAILDIKHSISLTKFEALKGNSEEVKFSELTKLFPVEMKKVLAMNKISDSSKILPKSKVKVNSFNVEFGYELISALPYAYKLFQEGRLEETQSGIDTEPLYFFSPKHIINPAIRGWHNMQAASGLPNIRIHKPDLDWNNFSPPPLKSHFKNGRFVYNKHILCICNRINKEWGKGIINYFDIDCLEKLFSSLKEKYQIVYFNIDGKKEYYDGAVPESIGDYDLARKHGAIVIHDLHSQNPDLSFNELQLMVMANCERFITMNGGYGILASYMGGMNIIYAKQCSEIKPSVNSFYRWYHKFGGAQIIHTSTYEDLFSSVNINFMEEKPLVNILTRSHNRPNYFKVCHDSIINQTYKNTNHIVSYDNDATRNYLLPYKIFPVNVIPHTGITVKEVTTQSEYGKVFPFNLYINKLKAYVKEGWIIGLDDDDKFVNEYSLEKIMSHVTSENDLLLWRVKFGNQIVPSDANFGKIVVRDISGIGFMVHSKWYKDYQMEPYRRADFRLIKHLSKKLDVIWIDEVLTQAQGDVCGMGTAQDIPIATENGLVYE